jgi:predicted membrane metal-binding protein
MRDKIFYLTCFGFILGVLIYSFVAVSYLLIALTGLLAFAFLFYFLISKSNKVLFLFVFLLAFSLGSTRFYVVDRFTPTGFENKVGEKINLTGMVVDEPTLTENNQKITIKVNNTKKVKILITTNFGYVFKYGDEVSFSGKLEKPTNFITDQGKNFDYVNYLRKDNILYVINYPEMEVISHCQE